MPTHAHEHHTLRTTQPPGSGSAATAPCPRRRGGTDLGRAVLTWRAAIVAGTRPVTPIAANAARMNPDTFRTTSGRTNWKPSTSSADRRTRPARSSEPPYATRSDQVISVPAIAWAPASPPRVAERLPHRDQPFAERVHHYAGPWSSVPLKPCCSMSSVVLVVHLVEDVPFVRSARQPRARRDGDDARATRRTSSRCRGRQPQAYRVRHLAHAGRADGPAGRRLVCLQRHPAIVCAGLIAVTESGVTASVTNCRVSWSAPLGNVVTPPPVTRGAARQLGRPRHPRPPGWPRLDITVAAGSSPTRGNEDGVPRIWSTLRALRWSRWSRRGMRASPTPLPLALLLLTPVSRSTPRPGERGTTASRCPGCPATFRSSEGFRPLRLRPACLAARPPPSRDAGVPRGAAPDRDASPPARRSAGTAGGGPAALPRRRGEPPRPLTGCRLGRPREPRAISRWWCRSPGPAGAAGRQPLVRRCRA